jgi:hypothetical protein
MQSKVSTINNHLYELFDILEIRLSLIVQLKDTI